MSDFFPGRLIHKNNYTIKKISEMIMQDKQEFTYESWRDWFKSKLPCGETPPERQMLTSNKTTWIQWIREKSSVCQSRLPDLSSLTKNTRLYR